MSQLNRIDKKNGKEREPKIENCMKTKWEDIGLWWNSYVQEQEGDLVELQEIITELNGTWATSESVFDRDPLLEDWTETSPQAGPLRTNQEENWSQWLAHLIRSSTGTFNRELFGDRFDTASEYVRCERAFSDEELRDRRVDIIAEFADRGISIEVKNGDEHYLKTPQTAFLTEKHHRRNLDWTHFLLLPKSKHEALTSAFGSRVKEADGERLTIAADGDEELDVAILYWEEISRALRRTLFSGIESAHWMASAYVFTTLIEQQISRFYAAPSLDDYRDSSLGISDIERLQSIDPDDQIEYLETVLEQLA